MSFHSFTLAFTCLLNQQISIFGFNCVLDSPYHVFFYHQHWPTDQSNNCWTLATPFQSKKKSIVVTKLQRLFFFYETQPNELKHLRTKSNRSTFNHLLLSIHFVFKILFVLIQIRNFFTKFDLIFSNVSQCSDFRFEIASHNNDPIIQSRHVKMQREQYGVENGGKITNQNWHL